MSDAGKRGRWRMGRVALCAAMASALSFWGSYESVADRDGAVQVRVSLEGAVAEAQDCPGRPSSCAGDLRDNRGCCPRATRRSTRDRAAAPRTARRPETPAEAAERRAAHYSAAETAYEQHHYPLALREYQAFIATFPSDAARGEPVVHAYWRIAQIHQERRQQGAYMDALADVARAFDASGERPGSWAAEYAANARFILADANMTQMERYALTLGRTATGQELGARLRSEVERGVTLLVTLRDAYSLVPVYSRTTWTIAALVQTGRLYELLVRGILRAEIVAPADVQRTLRQLDRYERESLEQEFESTVRGHLVSEVRPFECKAIAHYVLAVRAGRAGNLDNSYTRSGLERLQAYGEDRVTECVASERANIEGLEATLPGEFRP